MSKTDRLVHLGPLPHDEKRPSVLDFGCRYPGCNHCGGCTPSCHRSLVEQGYCEQRWSELDQMMKARLGVREDSTPW